jgi:hypothetical protein
VENDDVEQDNTGLLLFQYANPSNNALQYSQIQLMQCKGASDMPSAGRGAFFCEAKTDEA